MKMLEVNIDYENAQALVTLSGKMDYTTVGGLCAEMEALFKRGEPVVFDLKGVSDIDSAGVAFFALAFKRLGAGPTQCRLQSVAPEIESALKLAGWDFNAPASLYEEESGNVIEAIGNEAENAGHHFYYFAYLISEIFYNGVIKPLKGQFPRLGIFAEQLARIGAGSAPIVLLVAFLVGLTTAFQAAAQLRQFGANIYIADLVGISMMRELGPLMAAILVAGRSGAAITAEIGTMKVSEEIDAMTLLGINPIQYLAVPRIYAVSISQPLLGVLSALTGIIGGFLIAITYLDLNSVSYLNQSLQALVLGDLTFNMMKSLVFGWIIVVVGIYYGMGVSGGAEGVGKATTNSVVTGIFLIIVADCLFSFV